MKEYACAEENFLKDVARHTMTVFRDDGIDRHIRFRRPDSNCYWFDLITWPGALCIDGDCGTFVFRRLNDMFEFFRTDREYLLRKGCQLGINPGYWGEKVVSMARGGTEEFSSRIFREVVQSYFDDWILNTEPSDAAKEEVRDRLTDEVLSYAEEPESRAMDAAIGFEVESHDFRMRDFWDHRFKEPTFHFIWCCYAIAWGIQTYDTATDAARGVP